MEFTDVYRKYYALVFNKFVRQFGKEMAEEYTQDVFALVYRNFDKYDAKHTMTAFLQWHVLEVYSHLKETRDRKGRNMAFQVPLEEAEFVADDQALDAFVVSDQNLALSGMIDRLDVNRTSKELLRMSLIERSEPLEMQMRTGKDATYIRRTRIRAMKTLAHSAGVDF